MLSYKIFHCTWEKIDTLQVQTMSQLTSNTIRSNVPSPRFWTVRTPALSKNSVLIRDVSLGWLEHQVHSRYLLPIHMSFLERVSSLESVLYGRDHRTSVPASTFQSVSIYNQEFVEYPQLWIRVHRMTLKMFLNTYTAAKRHSTYLPNYGVLKVGQTCFLWEYI